MFFPDARIELGEKPADPSCRPDPPCGRVGDDEQILYVLGGPAAEMLHARLVVYHNPLVVRAQCLEDIA